MNEPDERERGPLELRCESIAPWLWRVAWRGAAEPSEAEREEILRVARSRESGALIVLEREGGSARPLPAALEPLTGSAAAALEIAGLPPAEECGAVELFAPRGRGRVVALRGAGSGAAGEAAGAAAGDAAGAAAVDRLIELLKPRSAAARALEHAERAIAEFASRDGWKPLPAKRRALDQGELLPAAASATAFDHEAVGGELFVGMAGGGGAARAIAGRVVRGSESFTLELAEGGRPLAGRSLVLLRATAPADRSALLRVELDDEDLGPWRLGDAQAAGHLSFDLFRVSSDLLAGRERIRLAFRPDGRAEIASLRWWFLTEEEPDGLWLTELEPAQASSAGPRFDRAADGALLVHDDELFLRGVALAPGGELRFVLPRGERRLVMSVAPGANRGSGDPAAAASLVVAANGTATRLEFPAGSGARREFTRLVGGGELVLENPLGTGDAGGGELLLLAPRLLR